MSAPVPQGPRDSTGQKGKGTGCLLYHTVGNGVREFPGGSVVKNPPANAGDTGSILGSGRSPGVLEKT